jgi:lipoprotein NlpI
MRILMIAMLLVAPAAFRVAADDEDVKMAAKLVEEAGTAFEEGKAKEAVELATKAVKLDPKNPAAHYVLGSAYSSLQQYEEAAKQFHEVVKLNPKFDAAFYRLGDVSLKLRQNEEAAKAFREVLRLNPNLTVAHDRLGDALLKLGRFNEAIAEFDEYLKTHPKDAPEHWRRGIALYYAGKFDEGKKQFELHRTVNPEDVENAAWHYLCNARATSPKKAREELIPVTKDARVPMKQVLELFAGKLKPQDVLDAAEKAKLKDDDLKEARFYANLYVALYFESEGDAKKALEHLKIAVEKYKIVHYMWDVADAHLKKVSGGR